MKKTMLIIAISLFIGLQAFAQEKHRESREPEAMAREMTEKMVDKLNLHEDQFEPLFEANLELAEARHQKRQEIRELQQQHDQRLENILDEEQYQRYQKQKLQRHEKMRKKRENKSERLQRMEQKREMETPVQPHNE